MSSKVSLSAILLLAFIGADVLSGRDLNKLDIASLGWTGR